VGSQRIYFSRMMRRLLPRRLSPAAHLDPLPGISWRCLSRFKSVQEEALNKVWRRITKIRAAYPCWGRRAPRRLLRGCASHGRSSRRCFDADHLVRVGANRDTTLLLPKIEECVEAPNGRIRADEAQEELQALGYMKGLRGIGAFDPSLRRADAGCFPGG
jgi:hypothetical protein